MNINWSQTLLLASPRQSSGPALCTTALCTETGESKVGLGKEILVKLSAVIIMCPFKKKIAWCSKTVMAWDYLNRSYFISLKWMQITELGRSPFLQFLEFCGFAYLLYTCYLPCWWIKQALYFLFYRPDQWWKILPMDGLRERVAGLGFRAGFLHPAYFLFRSYSVLFPPTLPASFLLLRPSALDMTLSP